MSQVNLIRKNMLSLLVSQVATWAATLAALVIVPNRLGSTDFGAYGFATGYVLFFSLVAALGTNTYISRAVARDPDILGPYVWNAVLLKVVLWLVLSTAAIASAYLIGNEGQTLLLIVIACMGMLPYLFNEIFLGALTGLQLIARPALWMVIQVYCQTIVGIGVLVLGGGVVAYAIVMQAAILIPMAATGLMVRGFVRGKRTFDFQIWRLLVVGGLPLLTLTFLNLLYGTLDVPIIHNMVGADPVGWYTLALRWVGVPVFITTAVVASYFPLFARHGKPVTDEFAPLVNRALHLVLLVTIPASIGLFFVAGDLIHFIYGNKYDSSIVLIQILAIGIPLIALDTVLATALVASNRVNRYLIVAATAAVLNPIGCIIAVPLTDDRWGNGAIGAAAVTVLTEVWVMGGALLLRSAGVMDLNELKRMLRILLAAAAMIPILMVSSQWPLVLQVGLSAIAYGALSLALRTVDVDEIRSIIRQVTRRGQGGPPDATGTDQPVEIELSALPAGSDLSPQP